MLTEPTIGLSFFGNIHLIRLDRKKQTYLSSSLENKLRPMGTWNLHTRLVLRPDFTIYADTSDCIISYLFLPNTKAHVRYDLVGFRLYDINLGATHTTIPSTRGVQIPIDLVSSTMDSIGRLVVLFKPVRISTSCYDRTTYLRRYIGLPRFFFFSSPTP